MINRNLIAVLKFALLWLIFNFCIGSLKHTGEAPMGVHQGAQCDRASLALNYYHNGMRFLYPEVHENRCRDGIVSCELPLSNYLAAVLYKLFGFHESLFRLLTFGFVSLGMYGLFLLFCLYLKPLVAYVLIFLINSSPILMFYAVNFIPDASALGLVLVAWILFFRMFIPHPYLPNLKGNGVFIFFALIMGLAIGSKTTCIIQWISMSAVVLLSFINKAGVVVNNRKKGLVAMGAALVIPVVWQLWARHLGAQHNSEYFMMHIPLVNDLNEYKAAWHVYLSNWPQETFTSPLHIIIFLLLLLPVFLKRKFTPSLWYLTIINTFFSIVFIAVMVKQFMYHDYYILCLLPAVFINWVAVASVIGRLNGDYWWLKAGTFFVILIAFYYQFKAGKEKIEMRYTPGNYWEQSQQNTREYRAFGQVLHAYGITREDCVLAGFDGAPNNVLYLLDLNGRRINRDFSDEQIKESVTGLNPAYVVSNDTLFIQRIRPNFKRLTLLKEMKYLQLYKAENH